MTDQQFNLWLQQLSTGGAASGAPSGGPGGGGGYLPPQPGGMPPTGGYGGGMGGIVPQQQFVQQSAPSAGGGGGGLWPGGAYPSYGRFLEGINDYLNGPRRAGDLTPGYRGQNVMSTDRPLPGELGYPNMGPGNYNPTYGEPVAQFGDEANFEYRDPSIEPPALPLSGGYLGPHEGIDVPPGVFPGPGMEQFGNTPMDWGDSLPPSPDFTPSDYFMSPWDTSNTAGIMDPSGAGGIYDPNSYTPYTDFGGGGDYNAPVYDPNSYTPYTDFPSGDQPDASRGGFEPMYGGNEFGTEGSVGVGDNPTVNYAYGPNGETYMYDQNWQWLGQSGGGGDTGGGQPSTVAYGGNAPPAPGFFTPNTSAPFSNPSGNPLFINPNDPNNNLTRGGQSMPLYPTSQDVFPGADPRSAGQFMKDAAGNIYDSAGKLVQAAGKAVGGLINNIMNDPGYSSQDYLASMGYTPGQGGSMWPGQASTDNFGIRGGSFFGGSQQYNPMGGDISGSNNPFGAGQVGRSSVPAPQGGMAFMGGGSFANPAALGGANARGKMLAERIRQAILAGTYRPPPPHAPWKYPSPVLQRMGIGLARNMGMVRTSGHPGGTMSFAYPGVPTPVNWATIGRSMQDFYANRDREDVMGAAVGVGTRGFGTPHAHTPAPNPT